MVLQQLRKRDAKGRDLRAHIRETLALGLPLVGAQLAQMLIGVTDTIMLGWYGTSELAGGVLGTQMFFLFWIFGLGFAFAIVPAASQAEGQGDRRAVRRSVRMGLWVLAFASVIFMLPLWFTRDVLVALGQQEAIAELSGRYMRIAQWSMLPVLLLVGLRSFLTALEKAQVVLWITLFTAIMNGILNYTLIFGNFGAPRLGIEGAAWATLGANTCAFSVLALYVWKKAGLSDYEIFERFWRPDWPAFFEIARLGWPIGLGILAEAGLFSAASLMIGWIGTVPLAAHGIALQLASLAFMIPLGLSNGATVRVGNASGRGDSIAVNLSGNAALIVALITSLSTAILFWALPRPLVQLFLDESNPDYSSVLAYAVPLLAVAAAFQLVDGLQVAAASILRGLKDTRVPMIIAVVSYWLIGVPTAYVLAFPAGLGGPGVWTGLAAGLAAAAVLLSLRFFRKNSLDRVQPGA